MILLCDDVVNPGIGTQIAMAQIDIPLTEKTFCTVHEAAEMLGIAVEEVETMVESGAIESWPGADGSTHILRSSVKAKSVAIVETSGSQTNQPRTLLAYVVDDDPKVLELYRTQFSHLSASVVLVAFSSVFDALLSIAQRKPKLLVLDLRIQAVDWFPLLQSLRSSPDLYGLKIVVGTGMSENLIASRGGLPPGVVVFQKPVPVATLEALTAEILSA